MYIGENLNSLYKCCTDNRLSYLMSSAEKISCNVYFRQLRILRNSLENTYIFIILVHKKL